jgi:hypothetical protein
VAADREGVERVVLEALLEHAGLHPEVTETAAQAPYRAQAAAVAVDLIGVRYIVPEDYDADDVAKTAKRLQDFEAVGARITSWLDEVEKLGKQTRLTQCRAVLAYLCEKITEALEPLK